MIMKRRIQIAGSRAFMVCFPVCLTFMMFFAPFVKAEGPPLEVRIGAVLGLTGSAAGQSDTIRKGIQLALEDLKKKGMRVDVNFEDDQTNSAKTVSAVRQMLSQDINLLIGPTWGFQVSAAKPVLEQSGALAVSPATTSDISGGGSPAIFHMCPSRTHQVPAVTGWLREKQVKRAFLLTLNNEWGALHAGVYREAVSAAGGEIVDSDLFDFGSGPDVMRRAITKARRKNADAILATGTIGEYVTVLKVLRDLQVDIPILADENIFDVYNRKLLPSGEYSGGVYGLAVPMNREFVRKFQDRFGEPPELHADRAYDAVMILSSAVWSVGSNPASVREYLRTRTDYRGYSGRIRFNKQGDVDTGVYAVLKGEDLRN